MGVDIHGWIEACYPWTEEADAWVGVARIDAITARNYALFALLFGIHRAPHNPDDPEDKEPLAAERGLPANISPHARAEYDAAIARWPTEYFGPTWITWAEISAVDWHAPVGPLVFVTSIDPERSGVAPGFWTRWEPAVTFEGPFPPGFMGTARDLRPGMEWVVDGKAYRVVEGQLNDQLGEDWRLVFRLLETLASRYGADSVRLTVWFGI